MVRALAPALALLVACGGRSSLIDPAVGVADAAAFDSGDAAGAEADAAAEDASERSDAGCIIPMGEYLCNGYGGALPSSCLTILGTGMLDAATCAVVCSAPDAGALCYLGGSESWSPGEGACVGASYTSSVTCTGPYHDGGTPYLICGSTPWACG